MSDITETIAAPSAGEHIKWLITEPLPAYRVGDLAFVQVTASGAIVDQDSGEFTIKPF